MNPACRLNLESKECQEWMNEVCAHCAHLLPGVEEAELWDKWWSDDLPAPFKPRVDLMSAYDCHKLRKEVAHQVTTRGDQEWLENEDIPVTWTICQLILLLMVMVSALIAMVCVLKILCDGLRRWSGSMKSAPTKKKKPDEKPPPPPPPVDVETPPQKDSCKPAKQPKAFISFGRTTDPRTRFGPYKHQKLLQTASIPECQPAEH